MLFYSLCSSSRGNCTYIGTQQSGVLVDAGFGIRNTAASLALADIDPRSIRAVLVTHEHSDHICGLRKLVEKYSLPVYASCGTLQALLEKKAVGEQTELHEISRYPAAIAGLEVTPFHTPHDCAESLGYLLSDGNKKIAVCTDLGHATPEIVDKLAGCDFVLLESNYDTNMLAMGGYPYMLKQRIASANGHLSNDDCACLLHQLIQRGNTNFLLGHLSQNNNLPQLALQNAISYLEMKGMHFGSDYRVDVAPVRNTGKTFEV